MSTNDPNLPNWDVKYTDVKDDKARQKEVAQKLYQRSKQLEKQEKTLIYWLKRWLKHPLLELNRIKLLRDGKKIQAAKLKQSNPGE